MASDIDATPIGNEALAEAEEPLAQTSWGKVKD